MKIKSTQHGMTLIEILIALLIGAFLLGGVLQIFVSSKQTNRMQENLSRLQENGRFAMNFLTKDVRMAGYWGCLTPSVPDVDIAGNNDNAAAGDNIDNGTDTLTLRGAFSQIPIGVCGTAVDTATPDNYYNDASSRVDYRINNSVLQKADTDADTNTNTAGTFQSLIEGIENMQILYGADTNADNAPDYYVPAGTVGLNMAQVVSIRISLLVRTIDDNLAAQTLLYNFNGVNNIDPGDRRIRRVFTSTIALRNRLQ